MPSPVTPRDYDAVLFDLDGVLTTTRTVHAAAWKSMFDEFLAEWDMDHGTDLPRFDERADYASAVDGKTRETGVHDFLASRGITLPPGRLTKWLAYHYGAHECSLLADRASLTLHQARTVGRAVVVAEHEREVGPPATWATACTSRRRAGRGWRSSRASPATGGAARASTRCSRRVVGGCGSRCGSAARSSR